MPQPDSQAIYSHPYSFYSASHKDQCAYTMQQEDSDLSETSSDDEYVVEIQSTSSETPSNQEIMCQYLELFYFDSDPDEAICLPSADEMRSEIASFLSTNNSFDINATIDLSPIDETDSEADSSYYIEYDNTDETKTMLTNIHTLAS